MDTKDIIEFDYNEHIYKIKLSQYINFERNLFLFLYEYI